MKSKNIKTEDHQINFNSIMGEKMKNNRNEINLLEIDLRENQKKKIITFVTDHEKIISENIIFHSTLTFSATKQTQVKKKINRERLTKPPQLSFLFKRSKKKTPKTYQI